MSAYRLVPLSLVADIHDYLRQPVSAFARSKRAGKYPYYGATGQVGWIDGFRQDGTFVLLGEDGAPFFDQTKPKAYMVRGKCWVNNHAHVLKGKQGVCDDEFLCHALNWANYERAVTGTTRPKLPQSGMRLVLVPLPPIGEQHDIVRRIGRAHELVEAARRAAGSQYDDLEALAVGILRSSLAAPKTRASCMGRVLREVTCGVGEAWKRYPVLGATREGLAPAKEPPGKNPERYKPVFPGTLFYNPMRILIGSIAFVDEDDEPGITSPDYVVLRGKTGVLDTRWFYYWLRSPLGERCIKSLARGAVRERMLFNRLAEGTVELPHYDSQVKASQALARIKSMRAAIQKQIDELDLMPQRLLAQVFGDKRCEE